VKDVVAVNISSAEAPVSNSISDKEVGNALIN
jgi:hypothetical protein